MATILVDPSSSENALKTAAVKLARTILGGEPSKPKQLCVMFKNKVTGDRFKGITIGWDELSKANASEPDSVLPKLSVVPCERTFSMTAAATAALLPAVEAMKRKETSPFLEDRAKVVAELAKLKEAGVGTDAYLTLLSQADDHYKSGRLHDANASLTRLNSLVKLHENRLATARRMIAARVEATRAVKDVDAKYKMPVKSITEFNGSQDELLRGVLLSSTARRLGKFMPTDGPFMLERCRIGARFRELEMQGRLSDSYVTYARDRIEAVVKANDPKRLAELRDNIGYLQKLIGLPPLAPTQNFGSQ